MSRIVTAMAALICVVAVVPAVAQVRGEIVGAGATRMPIAVPALKQLGGVGGQAQAQKFVRILRGDLEASGVFRVIDPTAYIGNPQTGGLTHDSINFDNWISIGALGLVRGGYSATRDTVTIETRFFDVADRSSSGGRRLSGSVAEVARMAHRMADAVIEFVTGLPGPFESRLAFVSNRGGHAREIYTYTFDGEVERHTNHRSITMAPSWHPSGRSLLFTSFRGRRPVLYSVDLRSGFDSRIASKMGVNVGGTYSPDGSRILLAREASGNTDIFELDPARGRTRRLTTHWGIDVEPGWSPDGARVVFCSSRSGTPQIYTMRINETTARRLTFDGKYNSSPSWSPDGKHIAYAGRRSGRFQIFVIPSSGGTPRQVTFVGSNEDPAWSPDSRYLAFSGQRGQSKKIYMVDRYGRWERQLTDGPGDDSSPSWSNRLN